MSQVGAATETIDFGGLAISFDARVLRPRPWTAAQGHWVADLAREAPDGPVLELCSGAGHIGLLAVHVSGRRLVCVDVNPVAGSYAELNAAANGMADRVEVRVAALDDAVGADERFPLVIADPPWVRTGSTGRFPEDPLLAIDGGDDGLQVARACVKAIVDHLAPGGRAVLQLGTEAQATIVAEQLADTHLVVGELRAYGDRGVLLRVDDPTGGRLA